MGTVLRTIFFGGVCKQFSAFLLLLNSPSTPPLRAVVSKTFRSPKMDRVGVTLLMLLSLALMRLSDSERRDSTGGTSDAASARPLVRDPQSRVRSQGHLGKRPEDGVSSTSSDLNVSQTSSEALLRHPARGTPENEHEPERASPLPRDSRRSSRHAPVIKPRSPHGTANSSRDGSAPPGTDNSSRDGSAPAPRESAPRAARQVAPHSSQYRSRVNHRQASRQSRRLAG